MELDGPPVIRSPLLVAVFTLLTLGIYGVVWWYLINRDLRDLGRRRGARVLDVEPWKSALAISLGLPLIVPALVTLIRTCRRVEFAEQILEVPIEGPTQNHFNVTAASVLTVCFPAAGFAYLQVALNRVWKAEGPSADDPAPVAEAPTA